METIKYSMLIILVLIQGSLFADDKITFTDIAKQTETGINYKRIKSERNSIMEKFKQDGAVLFASDVPFTPFHPRGNPGVALFDYDGDGDHDIYVTNGPNEDNSLYSNQIKESGELKFIDVASSSNVAIKNQDSVGVCYGDIDNDGDEDLYVLGSSEHNIMLENQGDGTFLDISESSHTKGGNRSSVTCSFGDINNDGLIDLVVANNASHDDRIAPMIPGFQSMAEHNQLFVNKGENKFEDRSYESGLEDFLGLSFSIAIVDYDMDGDGDIVVADDQGPRPPAVMPGGSDYGYIRVLKNNGKGVFEDITEISGTNKAGGWMGLAFGDLNSDNHIDMFATNVGDYLVDAIGGGALPTDNNFWSCRWFLGKGDGSFDIADIGALGTTPFGWGTSIADYNNDGDLDIIYYGGEDIAMFMEATNPGVVLENDGLANFNRDRMALLNSTNHSRRSVNGVAMADLNNDGFMDIVSVSNTDWPEPFPLARISETYLGGQFDDAAYIWPIFSPIDPLDPSKGFVWNHNESIDGTLSIEINSASNGNKSAQVQLLGTKGILINGKVNRDGIGAVVSLKTGNSNSSITQPVVSGGSFSSANSHIINLGMKKAKKATLDVLWPGGVRNRLYNISANEKIIFPEIPCSYADSSLHIYDYASCLRSSLSELNKTGMFKKRYLSHIFTSSMKAYIEHNHLSIYYSDDDDDDDDYEDD